MGEAKRLESEHVSAGSGLRAKTLCVLLVEDDEDDAELIAKVLQKTPNGVAITRVADEPSFRRSLATGAFDIVLSDWNLPGFDALSALAIVRETDSELPFVIVSGAVGEDTAVAAMRAGARDYVLKDRLSRLVPVVERELRESAARRARVAAERALERSEERYRRIVETTTQGVWLVDADRKTTFVNARLAAMLRARPEDLIGVAPSSFIVDWQGTAVTEVLARFLQGTPQHAEVVYRRTDGTTFIASVEATPIVDQNGVFDGGVALVTDISERREAERALEARTRRFTSACAARRSSATSGSRSPKERRCVTRSLAVCVRS